MIRSIVPQNGSANAAEVVSDQESIHSVQSSHMSFGDNLLSSSYYSDEEPLDEDTHSKLLPSLPDLKEFVPHDVLALGFITLTLPFLFIPLENYSVDDVLIVGLLLLILIYTFTMRLGRWKLSRRTQYWVQLFLDSYIGIMFVAQYASLVIYQTAVHYGSNNTKDNDLQSLEQVDYHTSMHHSVAECPHLLGNRSFLAELSNMCCVLLVFLPTPSHLKHLFRLFLFLFLFLLFRVILFFP